MEFFKKYFSSKHKKFDQDIEEAEDSQIEQMPLDETFVYNFKKNGGKFFYPDDIDDYKDELLRILKFLHTEKYAVLERGYFHFLQKLDIPVTDKIDDNSVLIGGCEYLIADNGSIMTTSKQTKDKRNQELPKKRVFIGLSNQIIESKAEALIEINRKYETYPSNIQTIRSFREGEGNILTESSSHWYDAYLILIESE